VALVLGAIVGLLLPETQQEHQLLGPKRDDLVHQAQEAVEDLTHRVGAVAGVAQSAAVEALGKAQDAAKEAVSAAVDTVKDEAKNQGLPVGA
jgi:molybdopterin synthase catalytic subunit